MGVGDSLSVLIDYIYTGKITISDDNVEGILSVANFLQLQSVKDTCANVLKEKLTVSNCLGIYLIFPNSTVAGRELSF